MVYSNKRLHFNKGVKSNNARSEASPNQDYINIPFSGYN